MGSFGALIHRYAIDEAVADGTVVPLLYEGRFVDQQVTAETIDRWFDKLCEPLNDSQRADLKRKFSRLEALSQTDQAVRTKALDISEHFRRHWKGTGFKAQLVAPSKAAAIRFKEALDGIGDVSSEVVISAPDDREGHEEVDEAPRGRVRAFWADAMQRFGTEQEYNRRIIDAFKGPGDPEILIVVSKLLTGFDAPRNTVLYICKDMKEHTLLQAIARVNRLHAEGGESKKFGFIIDYQGLLGELDKALTAYSALEGYDPQDLAGAVVDVRKEIARLPDLHGALWDVFRGVGSRSDMEAMERLLADDALRDEFYARLRAFSRCLHIAISSEKAYDVIPEDEIAGMRRDWGRFYELRRSVRIRYQEAVDVREFEPKIRALLDDHVSALPAETVVEVVNIHDSGALRQVAEEQGTGAASRADRIASATRRVITESMERNPAFYERFSKLLQQTIADYREKRLSESDYLDRTLRITEEVARGHREETEAPETIRGNEDALAFHEVFRGQLADTDGSPVDDHATARIALEVLELIGERRIVSIWSNETAQNEMRNALDDYFFDVLAGERGIVLDEATMGRSDRASSGAGTGADAVSGRNRRPMSGAVSARTGATGATGARHHVTYGGERIDFRVVRRARRTLEIAVEPDATVVVAAPLDAPIEAIAEKVRRRGAWIRQQQRHFSQFLPRTPEPLYVAGATHRFLGRQYRLKVIHAARPGVERVRGFVIVRTREPDRPETTKRMVDGLYPARGTQGVRRAAGGRAGPLPDSDSFRPAGLIVRRTEKRWGSLSPSGRLLLNRRLIEAPPDAIDYVIAHELCHVAEPHHGAAFYRLLGRVMPDWEERKRRLEVAMA